MISNVRIEVRERGKLMEVREGHNIMTDNGREWLAGLIGLSAMGPDTPERSDRLRYMSVGIGGVLQGNIGLSLSSPLVDTYPAGDDPNSTTGNEYNDLFPVAPPISTLERPVKLSGSTNPYATAPGSDVWLIDTPNFFITHLSTREATVHGRLEASDLILAGFSQVPLSEVALHTDQAGVGLDTPYSPAVGYFSFATITKTASSVLEFIWSVRFGT